MGVLQGGSSVVGLVLAGIARYCRCIPYWRRPISRSVCVGGVIGGSPLLRQSPSDPTVLSSRCLQYSSVDGCGWPSPFDVGSLGIENPFSTEKVASVGVLSLMSLAPSVCGIPSGVEGVTSGDSSAFLFLMARVSRGVTSCCCWCCSLVAVNEASAAACAAMESLAAPSNCGRQLLLAVACCC